MQPTPHLRPDTAAILAVGLGLCAVTALVTLSGITSEHREVEAIARVLMVAAPIGVGLYARHRPPFERFGTLLVLAGCGWFLTTLSNSGDPLLYSVGRIAGWTVEVLLIYLILAFPSGRLEQPIDRLLVGAAAVIVVTLYLPSALVVEDYPLPVPWTTCDEGCPHNAFMVAGSEPAVVEDLIRPLRELLTLLVFGGVAIRMFQRIRHASTLTRHALTPVLGVAGVRFAAYFGVLLGRGAGPESVIVDASLWLVALTVPLIALAFLAGLLRWWVFIALASQQLASRLRGHTTPEDLREALAEAFDDPSLQILYWVGDEGGSWADVDGHPVGATPTGRCLTEIADGGRRVAAIVHDPALRDDRAFVDAATSYALMAFDNHRLSAQTSSLLREVRNSRSRIQAAADDERRRIERDLHDGAQQRLVALRIKLELAAERAGGERPADATALRSLGSDVEDALEELRSLARGIYPAPLADRGLVEGLRAAALRSPLPTTVLAAGLDRYSAEIETAAYFCCLEALQNVAKHAIGATAAVIELSDNGSLHVEVRDDGAGFDMADVNSNVGFVSMRDRLASVGGELAISSSPGRGTRITASIPLGSNGAG